VKGSDPVPPDPGAAAAMRHTYWAERGEGERKSRVLLCSDSIMAHQQEQLVHLGSSHEPFFNSLECQARPQIAPGCFQH
jgi:hypothetical protein